MDLLHTCNSFSLFLSSSSSLERDSRSTSTLTPTLASSAKQKTLSLQIIDCIFMAKNKQNKKTFFLLAELVNKVCCILLWQINGIQCVRKTLTSRIESVSKNLLGNLSRECLFFVFWLNWLFCDSC